MARKIKFRLWFNNQFAYIGDLNNVSERTVFHFEATGNVVWQQYTGIKDKNGKDIYEGDILKGSNLFNYEGNFHGLVNYKPCRFQYVVKYPNGGYGGGILDPEEVKEHSLEVIGNIFQNPELTE